MSTNNISNIAPNIVFIVPYRNRPQHKYFFSTYMSNIIAKDNSYEIYFSHQCDVRTFNRGATKNIGFLAIKQKYPEHYKDMTFVFNDIDTIPFSDIFDYETKHGTVKHFYGFKYALGGIVSITGRDFELTNGYPNFWGWGYEDNEIPKRVHILGYDVTRLNEQYPLWHMNHDGPGQGKKADNPHYEQNRLECVKVETATKEWNQEYIKSWEI